MKHFSFITLLLIIALTSCTQRKSTAISTKDPELQNDYEIRGWAINSYIDQQTSEVNSAATNQDAFNIIDTVNKAQGRDIYIFKANFNSIGKDYTIKKKKQAKTVTKKKLTRTQNTILGSIAIFVGIGSIALAFFIASFPWALSSSGALWVLEIILLLGIYMTFIVAGIFCILVGIIVLLVQFIKWLIKYFRSKDETPKALKKLIIEAEPR